MTLVKNSAGRGAALVLAIAGLLTLFGSLGFWASCPHTPCGGILMGSSSYSGLDLGFGYVTALAGLTLTVLGIAYLLRKDVSRFAILAIMLAIVILATTAASVIWMYVVPGEQSDYIWPPFGATVVGIAGLIALVASLRWRQAIQSPRGDPG